MNLTLLFFCYTIISINVKTNFKKEVSMIWQIPEIWEILKTMEIAGIVMMVSLLTFPILGIYFAQGISYARQNQESVSPKTRKFIGYIHRCFNRSLYVGFSGFVLYDFCLILLILHPNVVSVSM